MSDLNGFLFVIVWILAACLLGFGISQVFSGWLRLSRRIFLIPYVLFTTAFLWFFLRQSQVDLSRLFSHNWIWGAIAGVAAGTVLVRSVRAQPPSREAAGGELALDLVWLGLIYGVIDALFLTVMPVLAVWTGMTDLGLTEIWIGRFGAGVVGLAASLLVTLVYHLGYAEYRNRKIRLVLLGNGLVTLAYLLSGNPLGALISHTAMHLAAVIRGPRTTIQLPPHTQT